MSKTISLFSFIVCLSFVLGIPQSAFAHRSGCHNLHTCPSDSDTYVCGDLGYACDGSTSLAQVTGTQVPVVVEKTFSDIFGRKISALESDYWKKRYRAEKNSVYKLRRVMMWHKTKGSFGPAASVSIAADFFRSVYGRNPTISENEYWTKRIKDKPTETAMKDTMLYHKLNNINH